ncbi:hypothetical protein CBP31_08560 [Oceanisphaera profunda]|uniref:DUF4168 domain-containing protein n=1 Tax=Oceanisphaera profunda TaxID=1416627 RepID=A0A1Y0D6H3_9GAMM|nr:DUF4168 domain-containing protein [Oceanisphaera profunda]ART82665.1 hypothetical protein CBP31_08560 [Oceanisphaera profunda]
MNKLKTLTAAITFATFGLGASAAMAQAPEAATAPQQQQAAAQASQAAAPSQQFEAGQQAGPVSDGDLKNFVKANEDVAKVRDEFTQKLNEESDQQKAQQLQMQAQEKMLEAVKDNELDALTYNAIAARIQTDTELQERVTALQ